MIKKEIRVIGIDDAPFDKFKKGKVLVVGVVTRGGSLMDGVLSTKVDVDGDDATTKIAEMINKSKFKLQLRCIFLDGIALGGFNVVDVQALYRQTKIPVVTIIRRKPDVKKIKETLSKLGGKEKIKLIEKAGTAIKMGSIYAQLNGIDTDRLKTILALVCTRSLIPEPIRLAHMIASGIIRGESRGKA